MKLSSNWYFIVAKSEWVARSVLETEYTNSRYKFSVSTKEFIDRWSKQGPAYHCAQLMYATLSE